MVFELMEGFTKHHHNYLPTKFKYKNCTKAKKDCENAEILNAHFKSLLIVKFKSIRRYLTNCPSMK